MQGNIKKQKKKGIKERKQWGYRSQLVCDLRESIREIERADMNDV